MALPPMTRVISLLLVAAACGKGAPGRSVDAASFKELTKNIHEGDKWDDAVSSIEKVLGPAKSKNDHQWTWAVASGDDCFDLEVAKLDDKIAGWSGGHVNKMLGDLYAKCAERAH